MPGPKIVYVDRVVWNFIPDPATASAALQQGEIDWWENPSLDLVPQIKRTRTDPGGEGSHRRDRLPPVQPAVSAVRQPGDPPRRGLAAIDQKEVMEAVAGAEPSLIKTDVGIFVPGTPMASTVGVEITRGPKDYAKLKQDLAAAGYKGEKVVILAATTIPTIWAEAQVASDTLKKIGFNTDFQSLEWGTVVQRRASKEPNDKGGWNIFYTCLGGFGNISPAPDIAHPRAMGRRAAGSAGQRIRRWRSCVSAWFDAPDLAAQKKIAEQMQVEFWQRPDLCAAGHVQISRRRSTTTSPISATAGRNSTASRRTHRT